MKGLLERLILGLQERIILTAKRLPPFVIAVIVTLELKAHLQREAAMAVNTLFFAGCSVFGMDINYNPLCKKR